ncbi:zona pellucida sperm-binding protein 4 [Phascolarctos cinereus]|uniref:Zona pellucida sperm-binding protein 4 n=1 Tax=Phascolarctos cinereus TaxID=38626 RepID=A0A6P5LK21_PHACI|nr:zona pellucida sperm-binding protein 4 [Phascolarctos cinereus]
MLWILLFALFSFVWGSLGETEELEHRGTFSCGLRSFQFTLPLLSQYGKNPGLIAWDNQGTLHSLQNDSSCGTWITYSSLESIQLEASYSGCYVTKWDTFYVMPIGVSGLDADGSKTVHKVKAVKCSFTLPALDAPGLDLCDVKAQDRLSCAVSSITKGDCENLGCCYSSEDEVNPCYYGNTVTAQCTPDGQLSVAVSQNVTRPSLLLDSVRLVSGLDAKCDPVEKTDAFVLFQFPLSACGTILQMIDNQAIYKNELLASRDVRNWTHGSITRDSIFRLHISCSYSIKGDMVPATIQVVTLSPLLPVTKPGPLALEMQIAKEEHYSSYYVATEYPVTKLLRQPIHVEVRILRRTDPNLVLLLHHCWATPSTNSLYPIQWPILVKGCPYEGDNYSTKMVSMSTNSTRFPSHYKRFTIYTFAFVDSTFKKALMGPVYLHCSASVCQPLGADSCTVTCPVAPRKRRNSETHPWNKTSNVSSKGPIFFLQDAEDSPQSGSVLDIRTLWLILSGTLIVAVLLMTFLVLRRRK